MGPFIQSKQPREPQPTPPVSVVLVPLHGHRGRWINGVNIGCRICNWQTHSLSPTEALNQWRAHREGPVTQRHGSNGVRDGRLVCTCGWRTFSIDDVSSGTVLISQFEAHQRHWNNQ